MPACHQVHTYLSTYAATAGASFSRAALARLSAQYEGLLAAPSAAAAAGGDAAAAAGETPAALVARQGSLLVCRG